MAELTTSQIIKISIGVIVLIIVIVAATLGFRNYIIPYFSGLFPTEEKIDFSEHY